MAAKKTRTRRAGPPPDTATRQEALPLQERIDADEPSQAIPVTAQEQQQLATSPLQQTTELTLKSYEWAEERKHITDLSRNASAALESIVSDCNPTALAGMDAIGQALMIQQGMNQVRQLLEYKGGALLRKFSGLAGSALGFRTDRDHSKKGPYGMDVIRDCLIEAFIRGLAPVGNEWNIISARVYITREGFTRLLAELPGLAELRFRDGVPEPQVNSAGGITGYRVPMEATWTYNGHRDELKRTLEGESDFRIWVKGDAYATEDAALGKARRKMMASIYERLSGSSFPEGDVTDNSSVSQAAAPQLDAAPQTSRSEQLVQALTPTTEDPNPRVEGDEGITEETTPW